MTRLKLGSLVFALVVLGYINLLSNFHLVTTDDSRSNNTSNNNTPSNNLSKLNNITITMPHKKKNIPYQMWQQYKAWHSQEALEREFQQLDGPSPERKFSIVYYSCPHQAGNRLRNFAESMIWSLLTNRTALWKYYSDGECRRVTRDFPKLYCRSSYNVSICQQLLDRNQSLPAYQDWKDKMQLEQHQPLILRHWVTHTLPDNKANIPKGYSYKGALRDNGIVDTLNETVVIFPFAFLYSISQLEIQGKREKILSTQVARERALALLTEPVHYIYGLIRHDTFQIQSKYEIPPHYPYASKSQEGGGHSVLHVDDSTSNQSTSPWPVEPVRPGVTIIVHSRHIEKTNDGSHTHHEQACLDPILSNNNLTKQEFCQLVLLSDREDTLLGIQDYVQQTYPSCHVYFVPRPQESEHNDNDDSVIGIEQRTTGWAEHGSFAGTGFFQDMSLVANQLRYVPTTRTAFVAAKRSSNRLVADTIHYELYRRNNHVMGESPPKVEHCFLEGSTDE